MHDADVSRQAPGNADDRQVVAFCHPRHANRHFAVNRLAIDTPFAGDHQVRIRHDIGKMERIGHNLNARPQLCAAKGVQARAHSPRRAAAFKMQHIKF